MNVPYALVSDIRFKHYKFIEEKKSFDAKQPKPYKCKAMVSLLRLSSYPCSFVLQNYPQSFLKLPKSVKQNT